MNNIMLEKNNLESEKHAKYQEIQEKEKPIIIQVSWWAIFLYQLALSQIRTPSI